MPRGVNKVILVGNLGADPEAVCALRRAAGGWGWTSDHFSGGGRVMGLGNDALVMRLRAIGALVLMLLLFWLPLWFALRSTLRVAWRAVSEHYVDWASAVMCAAQALITGRQCD